MTKELIKNKCENKEDKLKFLEMLDLEIGDKVRFITNNEIYKVECNDDLVELVSVDDKHNCLSIKSLIGVAWDTPILLGNKKCGDFNSRSNSCSSCPLYFVDCCGESYHTLFDNIRHLKDYDNELYELMMKRLKTEVWK